MDPVFTPLRWTGYFDNYVGIQAVDRSAVDIENVINARLEVEVLKSGEMV